MILRVLSQKHMKEVSQSPTIATTMSLIKLSLLALEWPPATITKMKNHYRKDQFLISASRKKLITASKAKLIANMAMTLTLNK